VEAIGKIGDLEELQVSPLRPFGVLRRSEAHLEQVPQPDGKVRAVAKWEHTLRVLHADGSIGQAARLPDNIMVRETAWSEDGALFYWLSSVRTVVDNKAKLVDSWNVFDPRTGENRPLPEAPKTYKENPSPFPLRLKQSHPTVTEEDASQHLRALWVESPMPSEQPRVLVCADGEWGLPSPRGDAALYYAQGAAWVVPLIRVEKQRFIEARRQAQKMAAISHAKQVGLALLMYSQDYDEQLPAQGQDVNGLIQPYLQNADALQGFSYSFPGGTLGSIADPANTILGVVQGPGGVAVIYVDGHVIWKPD
jgi:hypothetical protein